MVVGLVAVGANAAVVDGGGMVVVGVPFFVVLHAR